MNTGQSSAQAVTASTDCGGAAFASSGGGAVSGQGFLTCTGSTITYMYVNVHLYRCGWVVDGYCGDRYDYGSMGPVCERYSAGSIWCPSSGSYVIHVPTGQQYMVVADFIFDDADGPHLGSASSAIVSV